MAPSKRGRPDSLEELLPSWRRHLRAANYSPKTIASYTTSAQRLAEFLHTKGVAPQIGLLSSEHIQAFMQDQLDRYRPAIAATRYRDLQQLFKWLVDEGKIDDSPMARMRPPRLEERPVPIIRTEDPKALLRVCDGREFEERRDAAILRVLLNTGTRLGEIAGLRLEDLDLEQDQIWVMDKGRRARVLPLGVKTVKALDRYMRSRSHHKNVDLPWLRLGGVPEPV